MNRRSILAALAGAPLANAIEPQLSEGFESGTIDDFAAAIADDDYYVWPDKPMGPYVLVRGRTDETS